MSARSLVAVSVLALASALPAVALADALPPECFDASSGDACTTFDDREGTCVDTGGSDLECVENTVASSSTGASGTTSGTAASTSAGGGTGGGSGEDGDGDGGTGGAAGGGESDEGCAIRAPGSAGTTRIGAGLVFAAAALVTARRWLRRGPRS